ncbi:pseudouridine synthase family protein [Artemisia annua]|uniref:Pseudouridine synthase family protein n=1 Tax=Artemisia annua TaxID=35608 RepID=A0A2U1Q9S7_ARTAN|nr:pseudouridine synthase family protein [Artemisia annua]
MAVTFGEAWLELNDGLTYRDIIRSHDSGGGLSLIKFYSTKHHSSAPLLGAKNGTVGCRGSKMVRLVSRNCCLNLTRDRVSKISVSWSDGFCGLQITVDGKVVTDPDTVLRTGSELVYHRLPWKEPYAPHMLEVLFEDDHLIALNKPSGLQVLPGGLFQQRTVLTQLQWRIKNHELCPVPVHRLGRGTSGILLCAKTKFAKTRLAALFADKTSAVANRLQKKNIHFLRAHTNFCCDFGHIGVLLIRNLFVCRKVDNEVNKVGKMSKIYRALASGIINEDEVVIDQPIGTLKYPGVAKGLYVASLSGKPALSRVHVLKRDVQESVTVVQVEIQSGRPHQIRIHLSFIGHPLIGDPLYVTGGKPQCSVPETVDETFAEDGGYHRPANPVPGDCGYYLHAHQLVLCHPMTNETCFVADV